ncbi:D-alanyl-D-alanine carboxypeptidase [Streptosporangium canum]|uniref:D-alanyl-D-alanine carboxypeptidase n=1 Tax=Streptosporangium canum TaxID=324952 RepID=A0A1I3K7A0_9ACTN|nr:serine hydrolase domain-containing protein [Streptosporangium canum]SFI68392.1 D-alanyl-D-alanine carboxypeptidase [Streptosporangium canum]
MARSLPSTAGLLITAVTLAGAATAAPAAADSRADAPGHAQVQKALDQAVTDGGAPGMVAEVRDRRGRWFGSAGVADTRTGRERQPQDRFRIGSAAKPFTATVVLQLAAEGKLSLDDTVDKWLPGLVEGNDNDGGTITVRHLLNHTSGIFNYGNDKEEFAKFSGPAWLEHRYDAYPPEQLVKIGLRNPRSFEAPGDGFVYSNTGYILAGMIVEKVTGKTLAGEIERRIVRPLGLTGTYLPGKETKIRGPHPRHYSTLFATETDAKVYDVTDQSATTGWAAGGMVSTVGDLHRFVSALLRGKLLPPTQQREMFTMVKTGIKMPDGTWKDTWIPDTTYGTGVFSWELSCGVKVWGIGGAITGGFSFAMGTRDAEHMIATNVTIDQYGRHNSLDMSKTVLEAEFCPSGSQARSKMLPRSGM